MTTWARRIAGDVCTGVTALWCPIHGDCRCEGEGPGDAGDCPLHSSLSTHADPKHHRVELDGIGWGQPL